MEFKSEPRRTYISEPKWSDGVQKADFFIIFHNDSLLYFLFLQLTEALPLEFD